MECRFCHEYFDEPVFELMPQSVHHGKNLCPHCLKCLKIVSKPENEEKRTKTSKYSIADLGKDCCELCRRTKQMLGRNQTLELHHKDCNYKNDVVENLLVLCTQCHKQVHFNKTYLFDHYKPLAKSPAAEAFFAFGEGIK